MLIGNLTRDPELRRTAKGTAVTEIGLAINRFFTSETGERREETTFVDVTLWARLAELADQYLRKGRPVYIEGRLQLDTWDDKNTGQKRSRLRVVGEQMQFLGGRQDGDGGGGGGNYNRQDGGQQQYSAPPQQQGGPPPQQGPITTDLDDDEIPF